MLLNFKIRTQLFIFLGGAILVFGAALGVAILGMNQAQTLLLVKLRQRRAARDRRNRHRATFAGLQAPCDPR